MSHDVVKHSGILSTFADRYNMPVKEVRDTLKATAFPDADTDAEFIAMLAVANAYDLNPFLRQIYAFKSRGRIMPIVPYDGWVKIVNERQELEWIDFHYSDEKIVIGNSKPCNEWVECSIKRSDRLQPITVREYFDEAYTGTDTWNKYPKRMLRNRAFIQAARLVFGIGGIVDDDDAQRISIADSPDDIVMDAQEEKPAGNAEKARSAMRQRAKATTPDEPVEAVEEAPEPAETVVVEDADYVVIDDTGEIVGISDEVKDRTVADFQKVIDLANETLGSVVMSSNDNPHSYVAPESDEPTYKVIGPRQTEAILTAKAKFGWSDELFKRLLGEFGATSLDRLAAARAREFIIHLQSGGEDTQTAI